VRPYRGLSVRVATSGTEAVPHDVLSLAGHLKYKGIPTSIMRGPAKWEGTSTLPPRADGLIHVLMAGKSDRSWNRFEQLREQMSSSRRTLILVGREATYGREQLLRTLADNEIFVFGEPEKTISNLLLESHNENEIGQRLGGTALRGEPWNPTEYTAPVTPDFFANGVADVLWAVGCNRVCGYCPHGYNFHALYGCAHQIRRRTVEGVLDDILGLARAGLEAVRLVADQAFDDDVDKNGTFQTLCEELAKSGLGYIVLQATMSTRDVVMNSGILSEAARNVKLRLRLNMDFISDNVSQKFYLPSRKQEHLDAIKFCSEAEIPFELNYIFFHPFLTGAEVMELLDFLRASTEYLLRNPLPFAHYVLNEIFLSSLHIDRFIPSDIRLRDELAQTAPETKAANFFAALLDALDRHESYFVDRFRNNNCENAHGLLDTLEKLLELSPAAATSRKEIASIVDTALCLAGALAATQPVPRGLTLEI
jgi:hypothetical protein